MPIASQELEFGACERVGGYGVREGFVVLVDGVLEGAGEFAVYVCVLYAVLVEYCVPFAEGVCVFLGGVSPGGILELKERRDGISASENT